MLPQGDGKIRIRMGPLNQGMVHGHLDGQFPGNFPATAVFRGFAWFDFAAGKLPLQRYGHCVAPLYRQYTAALFDDRTDETGRWFLFISNFHNKFMCGSVYLLKKIIKLFIIFISDLFSFFEMVQTKTDLHYF
jgi:hypothetical protein